MKEKRPTRKQLIEMARSNPEAIADLVLALWDRIEKLEMKVSSLELNSHNSSKPPSSDKGNFTKKPKIKNRRLKSGRKAGGQVGHEGKSLLPVENPDQIIEHHFAQGDRCPKCGAALEIDEQAKTALGSECACADCEKRQVFELPAIRVEVIEHRAEKRLCSNCGQMITATFPEAVKAPVQYGEKIQSVALYLGGHQLIPYQRLGELFRDLFHCSLSGGTLANFVKRNGKKARTVMEPIREALKTGPLMHCDETGCRVHGKLNWLHVASTNFLTCYHINKKRGHKAMEDFGLLPGYRGWVIHDFWKSYYTFNRCQHVLCNAHLLRELTYVHEDLKQEWAGEMIDLLLESQKLRKREDEREPSARRVIGEKTKLRIKGRYEDILREGVKKNPEPKAPPPGKRGRRARGKALNLLNRLRERYDEIMAFFEHEGVPFDNNQAERDIRMMKVREKISGTFRSEQHAQDFCDLRSVISTARKQSLSIIDCLAKLIRAPHDLGKKLAGGR